MRCETIDRANCLVFWRHALSAFALQCHSSKGSCWFRSQKLGYPQPVLQVTFRFAAVSDTAAAPSLRFSCDASVQYGRRICGSQRDEPVFSSCEWPFILAENGLDVEKASQGLEEHA